MNRAVGAEWGETARERAAMAALMVVASLASLWLQSGLAINHDIAWLLDAGQRWQSGERLYTDIVEVNPPLIFYVNALLTAGLWSKQAYLAGVGAMMLAAGLWAWRLAGARWGLAVLVIAIVSGMIDHGQRDHLAAVVVLPYLLAERARRGERAALGAWCFIGFGLKPYFLLIPLGASVVLACQRRTWRPLVSAQNVTMGVLGAVYVAAVWLFHPAYFTTMIPLGRLTYFAYGVPLGSSPLTLFLLLVAVLLILFTCRDRTVGPALGALAGAVASFFVQGRFWSYHLTPVIAIGLFVALTVGPRTPRRFTIYVAAFAALGGLLLLQRPRYPDIIPDDARTVLMVTAHLSPAYPMTFERGVRHASRYPAIWPVPGAWSVIHDPSATPQRRAMARAVIDRVRRNVVDDIMRFCPDPIFVDARADKPYFSPGFDWVAFLQADPRFAAYRAAGTNGPFAIFRPRTPCAPPIDEKDNR